MGSKKLKLLLFLGACLCAPHTHAQHFQPLPANNFNPWQQQVQQPQQPQPRIDWSLPPQIPAELYHQVSGFQSPQTWHIPPTPPRMVQTQSGLQIPDYMIRQENNEQFVNFFMAFGYSEARFAGQHPYSPYVYTAFLPEYEFEYTTAAFNNNPNAKPGNGSTASFAFGVEGKSGLRASVEFSALSGMRYGKEGGLVSFDQVIIEAEEDEDGFFFIGDEDLLFPSGGHMTSQALMLNIHYPLPEIFEEIFGDEIVPYVGGGVGVAFNRISDYSVWDEFGYAEEPFGSIDGEEGFYEYDVLHTHLGATTRAMAWNLEAGIGVKLTPKTSLDFYYRRSNYGNIQSAGLVMVEGDVYAILYPEGEDSFGNPICDDGFSFNGDLGFCEAFDGTFERFIDDFPPESGRIINNELGVRLRVRF